MRRHRHCDNRYFLPPLYCRVGITAEEGTLLHYTICGRQSVRAAAKAAPDVFVANKRRSWREGRPLLFCLSVNRSDDACYTHMHTHSMYLPPPAVSRTRIFRGIPGQRGTSERDREGRGTKAVAPPLPNFFLLSPLLHDYTYTSDGYSARAALLGALPDRPAATSRILPSLTHSHARSTHAMRHPLTEGGKKRLSAVAGITALTNHRSARRRRSPHSTWFIHPRTFSPPIIPDPSPESHSPGLQSLYLYPSLSHCLPSGSWLLHLLASTHSTFTLLQPLFIRKSQRRTTDGGGGVGGGNGGSALHRTADRQTDRPHYRSLAPANGADCGCVAAAASAKAA